MGRGVGKVRESLEGARDSALRSAEAAKDAVTDKFNDLVGDVYYLYDKKSSLLHSIGLTKTVGDPESRKELVHRQTGGTCAVVSQEQVLKSMGIEKSEDDLYRESVEKGYFGTSKPIPCQTPGGSTTCRLAFDRGKGDYSIIAPDGSAATPLTDPDAFMRRNGGTWVNQVGKLIEDNADVEVINKQFSQEADKKNLLETILKTPFYLHDQRESLVKAEKDGKIALVTVDAGRLWGKKEYLGGLHTVAVTGVEVNRFTGEVSGYYINDSGAWPEERGRLVSRERFEHAWREDDIQLVYVK